MRVEDEEYSKVPNMSPGGRVVFGSSRIMLRVLELVCLAAGVDSKVLLQGETGTGKGLIAREIHQRSGRKLRRFVHVDCASLSPTLIESELFGHEKGAFTGAASTRKGRFELADGGTVFLDEIGDLHPSLQSKLLRVLEDRTFERVGGTHSLPMRSRVIAATSRDLWSAVQSGAFRQDLFFRLNVLRIEIPSLRERVEDIPLLTEWAIGRLSASLGFPAPRVSDGFYDHLMAYAWPGNVRELMNLVECLMVQRKETLDVDVLNDTLGRGRAVTAGRQLPLAAVEDESSLISEALIDTGGVVARAARRLGMPRSSLRYKIRRYRLSYLVPKD
jgi:two-component system NtrC family response regulator